MVRDNMEFKFKISIEDDASIKALITQNIPEGWFPSDTSENFWDMISTDRDSFIREKYWEWYQSLSAVEQTECLESIFGKISGVDVIMADPTIDINKGPVR